MTSVQWFTDNGTTGAGGPTVWSLIPGATTNYQFVTNNAGPVEFYIMVTNNSASHPIGAVSPVTTVIEENSNPPQLVSDLNPSGIIGITNTQSLTFTTLFVGSPPLYYVWQASSNNQQTWTTITGSNVIFNGDSLTVSSGSNLIVQSFAQSTNWFQVTATNDAGPGSQFSSTAELDVYGETPYPAPGTVQGTGDLIVNLQATNLTPGATFWLNNTGNAKSVGNFAPLGGGTLNVETVGFISTNMDDLSTNVAGDATLMNVLNVNGTGTNGLESAYLIPSEISSNGTRSFEAWVCPTNFPANATAILSIGNNSGLTSSILTYGATNCVYSAYNNGGTNAGNTGWNTNSHLAYFPPLNTWHYLAATVDASGNVKVYADGVLNNTNIPGTATNSVVPITHADVGVLAATGTSAIGNVEGTYVVPFLGYIASARLWSGVLTANQIANNFAQGPWATVSSSLVVPAGVPSLSLAINHGTNTLTWSPYANLIGSTNVNGPWTTVTNASPPYVVPTAGGASEMFFRAVKPAVPKTVITVP
jgi:hypothetical protein